MVIRPILFVIMRYTVKDDRYYNFHQKQRKLTYNNITNSFDSIEITLDYMAL